MKRRCSLRRGAIQTRSWARPVLRQWKHPTLPAEIATPVEDVDLLGNIPLWAVTLLGSLFIWVLSLVMIFDRLWQVFKLYMATALRRSTI